MTALQRYVRFWDHREGAWSLASVRILVGAVLFCDLAQIAWLDLVVGLWAPVEEGGIGPASHARPIAALYEWIGASTQTAFFLVGVALSAAAMFCVGCWTRWSGLVLLACCTQFHVLSPGADRGIDALLRNALVLLILSGAGSTWSIDAFRKTGSVAPEVAIPAWPRFLLIAQLALLYFAAGIYKQSAAWSSIGGYSALFVVLHKPHYTRFDLPHELLTAIYPLLQASTLATLAFEYSALLLPVALWLRGRADRPRLARTARVFLIIWIATGAFFHVALGVFLELGIFPWGCLALYPALFQPERVRAAQRQLSQLLRVRSTAERRLV